MAHATPTGHEHPDQHSYPRYAPAPRECGSTDAHVGNSRPSSRARRRAIPSSPWWDLLPEPTADTPADSAVPRWADHRRMSPDRPGAVARPPGKPLPESRGSPDAVWVSGTPELVMSGNDPGP